MTPIVATKAVFSTSTGDLLFVAPADFVPSAGQSSVALPSDYDDATFAWSKTARVFAPDLTRLKAKLIAQVKTDNETRVRTLYSTNYGKQKKYSRKQQEVMDFRALAAALTPLSTALTQAVTVLVPAFSLLSAAAQRKKFRFAMAEAAKRNVTIDVIIAEYETAIDTIEAQVADLEAIELEAVRAIKAASTATAARAAYAAINWGWRSTT